MLHNKTLNIIPLDAFPLNVYKKVCGSCTIYIVLFAVFFITSICISSVFIYYHLYLKTVVLILLTLILVLKQQFIKHI